jgi:plasmid stabilization system protein ParE
MAYNIVIKSEAEKDLDRIHEYLADNNFSLKILSNIKSELKRRLSHRPMNNQQIGDNLYKIIILRKNTVLYEIHGGEVHVLAIRAGGMRKDLRS